MAGVRRSTRQRKPVKKNAYVEELDEAVNDTGVIEAESQNPETNDGDFGQGEASDQSASEGDDLDDDGASRPKTPASAKSKKRASFSVDTAQRRRPAAARPPRNEASASIKQAQPHLPHSTDTIHPLPLDIFPTDERHTRQYRGPLPRASTGYALVQHLGGPDRNDVSKLASTVARWYDYDVLPSKIPDGKNDPTDSLWVPEKFEDMMAKHFISWYRRFKGDGDGRGIEVEQVVRGLEKAERARYEPGSSGELFVQAGLLNDLKLMRVKAGDAFPVNLAGHRLPEISPSAAKKEPAPAGWMLDVAGLVLAMDWLPKNTSGDQLLALSVIPHSDHEIRLDVLPPNPADLPGTIQLWSFPKQVREKVMVPARLPPRRIQMACVDWGRVRRLKWCPVPMPEGISNGSLGLLAMLTGDGIVRVVEMKHAPSRECVFEKIEKPLAALTLASEANVPATAFAWLMINRICIGHEDGSVTVWSINPPALLSRHPIQHTHVLTIQSAFPSSPYIIAVAAVGGLVKLVDLTNPSSEITTAGTHAVTTEFNMIQWCDHMQAFIGKVPSSNPQNHGIILFPVRHFGGMGKRVIKPCATPVCLAIGTMHPFLLTGVADGTVWANNPARLVFAPKSTRVAMKLRLFHHEFRPVEQWTSKGNAIKEGDQIRGAVRILTGWGAEPNRTPHVAKPTDDDDDEGGDDGQEADDAATTTPATSKKKKAAPAPKTPQPPENAEKVGVIFEPHTRIAAISWNPNAGFACWAAIAMASGVVKVMDLGLDEWNEDEE